MKLIDDILPENDFNNLEYRVMGNFPWYYGRRANPNEKIDNPYLYSWYNIIGGRIWVDEEEGYFEKVVRDVLERADEKVKEIVRVRMILNTTSDKSYLTGAHADQSFEHKTALLYMNDSDGNTIIYNEKFVPDAPKPDNFTILKEVEPKKNRLFIFDGLHYHAGTTPTTVPRRVVMNINYISA